MQDDLTHLALIVDRSGSMHSNRHMTCDAVNELMESQKHEPGRMVVDLVTFNHEISVLYEARPVEDFEPLVADQNYICGGSTALLDAVGHAVDRLGQRLAAMPEEQRPGKVMIVVQTDGFENASTDHTGRDIARKREVQEEQYGWAFLFLGADQDAWTNSLGIRRGSTVSYASAAPGAGFAHAQAAVSGYRDGSRSADALTGSPEGVDTREGDQAS